MHSTVRDTYGSAENKDEGKVEGGRKMACDCVYVGGGEGLMVGGRDGILFPDDSVPVNQQKLLDEPHPPTPPSQSASFHFSLCHLLV